jgi:5-(carboxyamino)imidazole ribonucleotide synthase
VSGQIVCYPLIENEHRDGILHRSLAPASHTGEELTERAQDYAIRVMEALNYVGVLTIEWFQDGPRLLANEMAPRVHNSGHWTIEGAETSQFANHLRAILNLPLGLASARGHSAMFNFIGQLPFPEQVLSLPRAAFHDYGKEPRTGRKVGHATLLAKSLDELDEVLPDWSKRFDRS